MIQDSKQEKRLTHVYTGLGKGKTTAAFGLAVRACGQGWQVLMIQFMKGRSGSGELKVSGSIAGMQILQYGQSRLIQKGNADRDDILQAKGGFDKAREAMLSGKYDMLILDEINVAVDFGLIDLDDLIGLIKHKPDSVELVLTGRYAHPRVVAAADFVSEILDIKHPYEKGLPARQGIDF